MLIVAGLCYYLHSKRTGFRSTDSIIDRLIVYAINRGVLTTMCHTAYLITTVALPKRFIDLPFGLLDGKLYCNTLLATLNAQKSLRRDGDNVVELGTQIFGHLDTSNQGNGGHRSTAGRLESAGDSVPVKFVMG
ncbi:hypothetical protein LXA43DRAFT_289843 [Ganoderma leucocontextum]|nr:hypothetical protein LXA43DRAFT_289843 [Ganoderma leucocontextum]